LNTMREMIRASKEDGATANSVEVPAEDAATEGQELPAGTSTTEAPATATGTAPAETTPAVATPAVATPAEDETGRRGRLDEAALTMFNELGKDDLMCAEDWIDHAEKVGKLYNLSHEQLCVALHRRAVGVVKAAIEEIRGPQLYIWPYICRTLIESFGRKVRAAAFRAELVEMDKIAGLSLFAALNRVEMLLTKANHPLDDTDPLKRMLAAFPDVVVATVSASGCLKKTWPEAAAEIRSCATNLPTDLRDPKMLARPSPKTAHAKPAGIVATVEPAETGKSATTGARPKGKKIRCYGCGEYGHIQWRCPHNPSRHAQSKN